MDTRTLLAKVRDDRVKFISLQFTDVTGAVKSVDIPAQRLETALEEGVWFDGSSVEGFARTEESDLRFIPEVNSLITLPWEYESDNRTWHEAIILGQIFDSNENEYEGDTRTFLKNIIEKNKDIGVP